MSSKKKVDGSWRDIVSPYVKVGGSWKIAQSAWAKVDDKWKSWFLQGGLADVPLGGEDDSAYPNFSTNSQNSASAIVSVIALQSDGKIVIGGTFSSFGGAAAANLVRLNSDGTLDTAFTANTGSGVVGSVSTVVLQSDGKILLGGTFATFNGTAVNRIARLNSNGTLDTVFETNTGTGASSTVNAVALQSDGKILLGGTFATFNGTTVNEIARLNSDGTLDTAFVTNTGTGTNGTIAAIAVQSDDKIVIGGTFATFNGTTVNRIARLNSDGTLDTAFTANTGTGAGNTVNAVALQSDGKILLGGTFGTFNGTTVNRIARLNSNGTLDTAFTANTGSGASGDANAIAIQSDGKIVIGGNFTAFDGTTVNRIARLNSDGSRDTSLSNGIAPNGPVNTIALQSDGKILIGGEFTSANNRLVNGFIRVEADGARQVVPGANNIVNAVAVQSDGKILIGGTFTEFNSAAGTALIRINSDGTRDTAFTANIFINPNGPVNTIAVQSDGKILIGGTFTAVSGTTANRIARLNSDGSRDTDFNIGTGFNSTVLAITELPSGKILVGGSFTTFKGLSRPGFVALSSTGLDETDAYFYEKIGPSNTVNAIAIQSDGKIVIGGTFGAFDGTTVNRIARLNSDGTLDTDFTTNIGTGPNGSVEAIALQSDGKILIGGSFSAVRGTTVNDIARLNSDGTVDTSFATNTGSGVAGSVNAIAIQSDGKILLGGNFTAFNGTTANDIARLNSDGTLDTTFTTNNGTGANNPVNAVALQSDGKIVIGGEFTAFNGTTVNRITRLNSDGTLDTVFDTNTGTGANGTINAVAVQSDDKIVIGGVSGSTFATGFSTFNGTTVNRIARLNSNGTLDTAFDTNTGTGASGTITTIAIQSDGKILIGGIEDTQILTFVIPGFTTFNGTTVNRIARLNSDGTLDTAFTANTGLGADSRLNAIALQSDGKIVIGGAFETFNGYVANFLSRLNSSGTLDTNVFNFKGFLGGSVSAVTKQSDGKILVGGSFQTFNGIAKGRVARLNSDRSPDTAFTTNNGTGPNNDVNAIAVQSDGKSLLGGAFTTFNGTTVNRIARLNSDGTLDAAFVTNIGTGANNTIRAVAVQSDDKILIGGVGPNPSPANLGFSTFNGTTVNRIARLNSDGTLDTAFDTNTGTGSDGTINSIALQSDGKVVIGGAFARFNNQLRYRLARIGGDIATTS